MDQRIINPESWRDWQYAQYQKSLGDDVETCRCEYCGDNVQNAIFLARYKYACEDCVQAEMQESRVSRDEAIGILKNDWR